jgi:hypothetical protein
VRERDTDRIRSELERTRQEVAASLAEVRIEVSRSIDWREWYRRHPATFVIGAFMVGFTIGCRRHDG